MHSGDIKQIESSNQERVFPHVILTERTRLSPAHADQFTDGNMRSYGHVKCVETGNEVSVESAGVVHAADITDTYPSITPCHC